jgi:hypothetical protein
MGVTSSVDVDLTAAGPEADASISNPKGKPGRLRMPTKIGSFHALLAY